MTSISQLRSNGVCVRPVNSCLAGSCKEVSAVCGQRDRSHRSEYLCFCFKFHVFVPDLCNGSVACSNHYVSVLKLSDSINSKREQTLYWTNSLKESHV